jgi:hypothetical protein
MPKRMANEVTKLVASLPEKAETNVRLVLHPKLLLAVVLNVTSSPSDVQCQSQRLVPEK